MSAKNLGSVCGIVFSPDRRSILLVKRRDVPVWVLPGGGIELNETPAVSVRRELEEETGYKVDIIRKIAEYTPMNRLANYTHFYECRTLSGRPVSTDETLAVDFFNLDQLPLMPPPYSDWIKDACKENTGIIKKDIKSVNYKNFIKLLFRHPILVSRFVLSRFGLHINEK